ncbi:MAG: ammonium transporter [Candidatus Marinimicrobia bacterium]|jgi:ammonium transporter, Amt family|nr:ammonium transporter [Candidatus Neomarinimicrobiota bacterium]MBT3849261.1 ammonium transporter [Candidatus Neomarinimicrobiota bacterium]MBT4053800.1 ammonium transporter [Candidatus Neomarinimicrobiota bacterium]MBT4368990.1 ammonium transporter [Candidatus Neomarinimicrobiota bacterium]MBT5225631.1 ammonium transporter [Candidatus Neomarinimicrobiota bacterium]
MIRTKILLGILFFMRGSTLLANGEPTAADAMFTVNNTWMLVSTFLVFIMHLGFASLEAGLTQSKNTVNILFKNVSIIAIGILTYAICGFNLMYPGEFNGYFGFAGFGITSPIGSAGLIGYADGAYTYFTDFIFQAMFAATAATIVSGAVAERIKLSSFLIFSTVYVAIIYPVAGSWKWGAGWLDQLGFYDFAGSTLVHSVGGWAALVGAILVGSRIGKYGQNGRIKPILGHNMPLATIGVFLLWFGWYGFNGGSVLSADPGVVSLVFVTTTLAAAAGVIGAMITSWYVSKKPDLSMILNGSLAGLVGITAGADVISPMNSVLVGFIAGIIVVLSVIQLDKLKIDDPVGAISVHLICGIWGTLAVGVFSAEHSLSVQALGVVAYGLFCLIGSILIFTVLKYSIGLRVSEDEEIIGLDIGEHDMESYAGFQIFTVE